MPLVPEDNALERAVVACCTIRQMIDALDDAERAAVSRRLAALVRDLDRDALGAPSWLQ